MQVLFLDEISTGLDSSTTFAIMKFLADLTHFLSYTTVIALLQPAPETYDLFDDILLLSGGADLCPPSVLPATVLCEVTVAAVPHSCCTRDATAMATELPSSRHGHLAVLSADLKLLSQGISCTTDHGRMWRTSLHSKGSCAHHAKASLTSCKSSPPAKTRRSAHPLKLEEWSVV